MSWQPAPESLRQLAACLKDSLSGFDKNAQKQAELMLKQAKGSPDINNYLAYILSSPEPPEGAAFSQSEYHLVRSAAGIMLKNNLKSDWKTIPESSLQLIKLAIPIALQDKNIQIRNFAGNVATEIVQKGGLLSWPDLLPQLIETFGNVSGQVSNEAQEGAMSAMSKICEDNTRMLTREVNGQRPLNYILPQLIAATKSPLPKVRIGALTAINVFTPRESQAMNNSIDDLLQHLFTLANDESPDVRRQVCRSFVSLADRRPEKLIPHMAGLVDYTIRQQRSDDEELSCEAAEFWLTVGEHDDLWQHLRPYIEQIIPLLLEYMVYSGEDIALLGGQSDDEDEEDRDWPQREAAVLALGAVAEGCESAILPHLPMLVPYLISLLTDPEPVIRTITCWTLGRYSGWAANLPDAEREQFFLPLMDGMLQKMLDRNKKVQEAGASAFANVEERAGKALIPFTEPIVKQFVICFQRYKDRNMYILYDCVQTLAEQVGPTLATPHIAKQLLDALLARYNMMNDESREMFPLLECLSYVALAMDTAFAPYAGPIFQRCINIIHNNLEQSLASVTNTSIDAPDKDFLITALDLLSAIIQALSPEQASQLVSNSPQPVFELLSFCMEDPTDEVRQSAYALLGDCARFLFPLLEPHLPKLLPFLVKQLDMDEVLDEAIETGFGVVNNACWSAGEIAVRYGDGMKPFVQDLMTKFVEMMGNPRVPRGLVENAATALGRLGQNNAHIMAHGLGNYAALYLGAMEDVVTMDEKASAMKGFTAIVRENPLAMEPVLLEYFSTIANYNMDLQNPLKQQLQAAFQDIINIYKANIPQFDRFIGQLNSASQEKLRASYTL
ncbi:Transportin-1 [Beauveria bassiana]|uniref:Transportin-1 n=1 Tax=Beauveria bassiana TaxID=176275 RepID=A0A2N6NL98_BEABA|nr:Transportin-1 [Beauveria bassiana]